MTTFSNILMRFDGKVSIARGSSAIRVRGSNGADTVTLAKGVEAVLDGSFNRGNDVINFNGLASSYSVARVNSSSIRITDMEGTSVTIPVGSDGTTINFADAQRVLLGGSAGISLGQQAVTSTPAGVAAGSGIPVPFPPNDEVGDLPGANPSANNIVILAEGASVAFGEGSDPTTVRGSNGADTVAVANGSVLILDGSFNRGNDTVKFEGRAEDYEIRRSGSSAVVITDAGGTSVTIPVGVNGLDIVFANATRELIGGANGLFLNGDNGLVQEVTNVPTEIAAGDNGLAINFHTLTEVETAGSEGTPPVTEIFWGFNPNSTENDNSTEGPNDGGIPLSELVKFVTTITGLDLAELGLIDDDGMGPFDNVTNLTISNATTLTGEVEDSSSQGPGSVLEISFSNGTQQQFNIEAQIGEQYFNFLNNLLFDSEGNSRLFVKVVDPGTDGESPTLVPIRLTPTENNGGTLEGNRTSNADDTIVVGRLELLHQAYIDAGAGYNTLEIDAKGTYAQPTALLNVQEIRVTDLPNFYTIGDGEGGSYLENTATTDAGLPNPIGTGSDDSWIDLTRAGQLQLLVVSDQGNDVSTSSGDLTIVGVRNGATLRLEGGFDSGDTTIQYADVDPAGLTVQLNVGDVTNDINILQNSAVLNIVSEGVSNYLQDFFVGGRLTNLNISGTGRFAVDGDLDDSFEDDTPIVIDASENSGGVDLEVTGSQNVTIVGSSGDDRFSVTTSDDDGGPINDETVSITGGEGNNYYQVDGAEVVTITNGDGNNNYEVFAGTSGPGLPAVGQVTITTGNGDNKFELEEVATAVISAGDGNNRVEITSRDSFDYTDPSETPDWLSNVNVTLGDGRNTVYVQAFSDSVSEAGVVTVEVGSGRNEIVAGGRIVDITTAGSGPNTIAALGEAITIDNASSTGSTIVLAGAGEDFSQVINALAGNSTSGMGAANPSNTLEPTVLLDVQAGTGARVLLGLEEGQQTLTALPGSVISGQGLTLEVRTIADLRAADLNGVTSVVLDDDNFEPGQSTSANSAVAGGNASVLVVTDKQFAEIGAANFSVDGAIFNTHSFVKIIVTESTSLTALGVNNLPRNIDLILEIQDGVTLTMTAEQLHTRVAQEGVILANDGNTDIGAGRVLITGAGADFDAFNTSDKVQTQIAGTTYFGGSLSSTDFPKIVLPNGREGILNANVTTFVGGYDRPSDFVGFDVLTLDTDANSVQLPVVAGVMQVGPLTSFRTEFEIVGSRDVNFTGPLNLGVISGSAGPSVLPFTIDFSALEGEVSNLVVDGFERLAQGGGIYGNTDTAGAVEVLVSIAPDDTPNPGSGSSAAPSFGWDEHGASGLVSQGVTKYTVATIEGSTTAPYGTHVATIQLCDKTEDLEVIALRGNWNDVLNIVDAAWGLGFELQGGGTAKAEGPTGTSNVGELIAAYQWDGADAEVNIIHANASDTRPIFVAGITINNADTLSITAPQGDVVIKDVNGDSLEELTIAGSGDVTVEDTLPSALESIDASAVAGVLTVSVDGPSGAPLAIVGAQGGSTISLSDVDGGDIASIAGAGPVTLVISDGDVDLSSTALSNVVSVVLEDGANLTLTFAQADAIGAGNFVVAPGDDASLSLEGLGEQPFAIADYADGISVEVVSVIDQPVVTLNAATNLTGVGSLMVPEGVTLNLTAAQFQQLTGSGTISIIDTDDNPANDAINVNITDLVQANVTPGFVVTGIDVGLGELSVTLGGSVVFTSAAEDILQGANGDKAVVNIGDGLKLTLANVEQIDEMTVNGGAGSTVEFTDVTGFLVSVDASGLDVDVLRLPTLLVSGNNVDFMFQGLSERVEKVIFQGIGDVEGRSQLVVVEEGVTILDDISFNEYLLDVEVTDLVVDLRGGTLLNGDLVFSTVQVNTDGVELIPAYLQQLTIISSGTAANSINGETANVITGNVTPGAYGPAVGIGSRDNQLKSMLIDATQDLVIEGSIIFSSHGDDPEGTLSNEPDDGITANNDDSAIAVLEVTGSADVTIGNLDTSDGDIDGLNVVNNGTGTVFATLNAATIDNDDVFSFTGGDIQLTVEGSVDLSDDDITAVSQITIAQNATLTISQEQFDAIGAAGIIDGGANGAATLIISDFDGGPFDATGIDPDINVSLTLVTGTVVLDGNFTGVDALNVVEGTTVQMTAAQFQQLQGSGTINVLDGPDAGTAAGDSGINIVITDLTQAQVNSTTDPFDLANVNVGTGGTVTVTLGEPSVDLGRFNSAGVLQAATNIVTSNGVQADFDLVDGQTLGVVNGTQANSLTVDGVGTTTVVYKFVPFGAPIDASGLDVTFLRALAAGFTPGTPGANDVETQFVDLASGVTLVLFADPLDLGFLDPTFRVVVIEEGITTPAGLIFNDPGTGDEVRALDLTLEGDVTLNGDLSVPTRTDKVGGLQVFFESMTIRSEGAEANTIAGSINTATLLGAPTTLNNNLLSINIVADQDLVVTGEVTFNAVGNNIVGPGDRVATLNVSGLADVTIKSLNTTDPDISGLVINQTGAGVLTITGGSDALELNNTANLSFTGTGDIVLDTDDDMGNNGIEGTSLRTINASGLSGDLTLGVIEEVNNAAFTLTAGSGVTIATLADGNLNSTGVDAVPGNSDDTAGWVIDYTNAAVGSQFHLDFQNGLPVAGSKLTINMGPNGVLSINGSPGDIVDLSELVLDINTVQSIVLGDEVTLVLTAQQADGLSIVAGPDSNDNDIFGTVNIVGLTDDPNGPAAFDLSGIADNIAGTITFAPGENDVTLDAGTDLGAFAIDLVDVANNDNSLAGQTIRFTTVDQADGREINVNPNNGAQASSSTNVVWLFTSIPGTDPVDTADYDPAIGRLWLDPALINSEGGDVEQLFTTLPSTILRVEFSSLAELEILLAANPVNRIVEFVHFTDVGDLTFNDVGASPDEFISSLDLRLGGEVSIGDINLGDVVGGDDVDPATVFFNSLTINSFRAVERVSNTAGEILSAEGFRNDNDGTAELIGGENENAIPVNSNVIGDISGDDANAQIDLLRVNIDTKTLRTTNVGNGVRDNGRGEAIEIGTITFDSSGDAPTAPGATIVDASTATLDITGANNVTIVALDTSDTDIVNLVIDLTGFTAVLDPVLLVDNTETVTVTNSNNEAGTAIFQDVQGDELSVFDASDFDGTLTATFSEVDSTNDDSTLGTPANDGLVPAFTFTSGEGVSVVTVAQVGSNTPTLSAGSAWVFDFAMTEGRVSLDDGNPATPVVVGSQLIIDETVDFEADSDLVLINASTYITGDVDLSDVNLTVTQGMTPDDMRFYVGAGSSLTITVAQALALEAADVEIFGEGTVVLVGDATDVNADLLGGSLFTAVVDASAVTIAPLTDPTNPDDDQLFILRLEGAFDFDGEDIGQTVIGSAFNDDLRIVGKGLELDYVFDGGAGNDVYRNNNGLGDYTYLVKSGSDTINRLQSDGPVPGSNDAAQQTDILKVSAGATATALVRADFFATSETSNAGTVFILEDFLVLTPGQQSAGSLTVDLSLAQGPNGYNVTMATDDVIIGSAFNDILNGGAPGAGVRDVLTGNPGADIFVFDLDISDPATFTIFEGGDVYDGPPAGQPIGQLTNDAEDFERVDIDTTGVAATGPALVVSYRLNNVVTSINVSTTGVDTTNENEVAQAIADAFDALLLIEAETAAGDSTGDHILFAALEGASFEFLGIGPVPTFTVGGITSTEVMTGPGSDDDDVQQVSFLDIVLDTPTATAGERYNISLQLRDGTVVVTDDYVANGTETEDGLRDALLTGLQDKLALIGSPIAATAYDSGTATGIRLEGVDDAGGFAITDFLASGSFNGSGASSPLLGTAADLDNADIITDFLGNSGDRIDLGLDAGTSGLSGNLAFDTGNATYEDAFNDASAALGGSTIYYFSSIETDLGLGNGEETVGLLFFDANTDGTPDGLVVLPGIDETIFNSSFIIG